MHCFLPVFVDSEYESITSKELPIVNEITSVLREWGTLWKNLYAVSTFKQVCKQVISNS